MPFELLGKEIRGKGLGFPSGVIATNTDTARDILKYVYSIGVCVGKSTTIEPREGNEDFLWSNTTSLFVG